MVPHSTSAPMRRRFSSAETFLLLLLASGQVCGERPDDGYRLLDGHYVGRVGCDRRGDLSDAPQPHGTNQWCCSVYGLHRRRYGPGWGPPRASPHLGRPQVGITAPGGGLCAFPIPNKAAFTADQLTHLPPIPWHSRSTRPPPPPVRASMTSIASMRALMGPLAIRISRSSARNSPLQAAARGTFVRA